MRSVQHILLSHPAKGVHVDVSAGRKTAPKAHEGFAATERSILLAVKGVGPTVVARLEQMGISTLDKLARADAATICSEAAGLTGGTCWKNSPMARKAITAAIETAQRHTQA